MVFHRPLDSILYRSLLPPRKHLLKLHSGRVSYLFSIKRVENFSRSFFYPMEEATPYAGSPHTLVPNSLYTHAVPTQITLSI